jgi:hypothetical protein
MSFLIPEVLIIILTDAIFLMLMIFLTPSAAAVLLRWDFTSSDSRQYAMEKKRLLVSTVIAFALMIKIPLFLFFIYTNDKLANVLTGAMCAAGALNSTPYGTPLLYIKTASVFLSALWLTVYRCNNHFEDLRHTKKEYALLAVIILLAFGESIAGIMNFSAIDPTAVVSCCSSIYSPEESLSLLNISPLAVFISFTALSFLLMSAYILKKPYAVSLLTVPFFAVGVLNLIVFTSTYVYELPSHRCPYCILQKEYYYVGYLFYVSLFAGTAAGLSLGAEKRLKGEFSHLIYLTGMFFCMVFIILSLFFPLKYYIINSVWL